RRSRLQRAPRRARDRSDQARPPHAGRADSPGRRVAAGPRRRPACHAQPPDRRRPDVRRSRRRRRPHRLGAGRAGDGPPDGHRFATGTARQPGALKQARHTAEADLARLGLPGSPRKTTFMEGASARPAEPRDDGGDFMQSSKMGPRRWSFASRLSSVLMLGTTLVAGSTGPAFARGGGGMRGGGGGGARMGGGGAHMGGGAAARPSAPARSAPAATPQARPAPQSRPSQPAAGNVNRGNAPATHSGRTT